MPCQQQVINGSDKVQITQNEVHHAWTYPTTSTFCWHIVHQKSPHKIHSVLLQQDFCFPFHPTSVRAQKEREQKKTNNLQQSAALFSHLNNLTRQESLTNTKV